MELENRLVQFNQQLSLIMEDVQLFMKMKQEERETWYAFHRAWKQAWMESNDQELRELFSVQNRFTIQNTSR